MKTSELRGKSADELNKLILDNRKEQFNLRFQKANGQLENTAQLRGLRRDIARAKTLLSEAEKGIAPKAATAKTEKTEKKTAAKKPAAKKETTKKAAPKKAAAKKKES